MSGIELTKLSLPPTRYRSCPKCTAQLRNTTHDQSLFGCCPECKSYASFFNGEGKIVATIKYHYQQELTFKLGSKINLKDHTFEVVGHIYWNERNTHFYWSEYVLFNPYEGYVHLVENYGNYVICTPTLDYPNDLRNHQFSFFQNGREFKLFNKYKADICEAVGEFYWNIIDSDDLVVKEFICPPVGILFEQNSNRANWMKMEYISRNQLQKAAGNGVKLKPKAHIGMLETFLSEFHPNLVVKYGVIFGLLLIALHFILSVGTPKKLLYSQKFSLEDSTGLRPWISPSFKVEEGIFGTSNLEFELNSTILNDWIEASITLINEDTDVEYDVSCGAEYYSGYDDGNWSEGSTSDSKLVSEADPGMYHFVVTPYTQSVSWGKTFEIKLYRNVPMWSNLLLALFFIGIIPILMLLAQNQFEKARWQNSDFSTYD